MGGEARPVGESEFERAFVLMGAIDEGTAERLEPTPYGPVVVNERLDRVHDLNFMRADRPGGATADQLAAEAERVQGAAGIGHRRVNLRDETALERLQAPFLALGWSPERFVLMAQRRDPDRPAEAAVQEVDEATLRPVWAEGIRRLPHGQDEEVVRQILEHRRLIADAVPTRFFAAADGGRLVAHCELYTLGGAAQIENVVTLAEFRRRGFARALVLHAADEARAAGNDLVFLVADADDWPRKLYERLGFETIGRYGRFLKLPRNGPSSP